MIDAEIGRIIHILVSLIASKESPTAIVVESGSSRYIYPTMHPSTVTRSDA
jgi:hypothetical protein